MINIKDTFLKLTQKRYTYGSESEVIKLLPEFKFEEDNFNNYFIIVKRPNGEYSDNMFTCHLDTVSSQYGLKQDTIKHVFDGDFIKTDNNTNLGADDKAGMVIMLNMITENIPGLYYFFIGEEVGGIGSSPVAENYMGDVKSESFPKINRCISFDRGKYNTVTTFQSRTRCCSDEFAHKLAKELNLFNLIGSGVTVLEDYKWYKEFYKPDSDGGRTDSYRFIDVIPECTNLSVGYTSEHTVYEKQDIKFLEMISQTMLKIDWDSLPIVKEVDGDYKPKVKSTVYRSDEISEVHRHHHGCY